MVYGGMKKILALIILSFVFVSCKEDPNPCSGYGFECTAAVESHWELVEIYSNIGSGPGSFNPIESERTITIFENGDFISKGSMCSLDATNTEIQTGEIEHTTTESKMVFSACNGTNETDELTFTVDGDEMIVEFTCFEGCAHKYKRVY